MTRAAAATAADAKNAADAAAVAFPVWASVLPSERRRLLLKAADVLASRAADFTDVQMGETGVGRFQQPPRREHVARDCIDRDLDHRRDAKFDPGVAVIGVFRADTHPPTVYPIAAVALSYNPDTARLLGYLTSPAAKPIFAKYGYTFLPKGS